MLLTRTLKIAIQKSDRLYFARSTEIFLIVVRGGNAKLIDAVALLQAKNWSLSPRRHVDWDWIKGYNLFKFRYPKRFEMALWQNNKLVSLTLGRPTYAGGRMRLDFIEASPDKPKELKVFEISLFAIGTYAKALGAHELRIMHPINERVRDYYARFGLLYMPKGDYLYTTL